MQGIDRQTFDRFGYKRQARATHAIVGNYQIDISRLQKLAVILGLAAVCWAPIVSLVFLFD